MKPRSYRIGQYKDGELVAVHQSMAKAFEALGVSCHFDAKYIGEGKMVRGYLLKIIQ